MTFANTTEARSPRAVKSFALLALAAVAGLATPVRAADMPDDFFSLRGPVPDAPVRWDGFVAGGQIGYVNSQTDFGHATRETVETLMKQTTVEFQSAPSEWKVLGKGSETGQSYGAFIGYNWQLDSIVVGVDAAYNYTGGITTRGSGTLGPGRVVPTDDGSTWLVKIRGNSSLTVQDYATLRARVGYPMMGQFLPYAFVGGAVGRFDYLTVTGTSLTQNNTTIRARETLAKDGAFTAGVAAGLGVDVALLPNMFLRAEYEFIGFAEIEGIRPTIQTGRVGLGFRF